MADGIQGRDHRLPDRRVARDRAARAARSNASPSPMRANAPAAGSASSRIAQRRDERRRRPPIADPAERHRGRLPGVEILGPQLLDQQIDDAGAVPHQRFDDLRPRPSVPEQAGQRALHRRAARATRGPGRARQPIGADAMDRIEQLLRAGGADVPPHEAGDVLAGAVAILIPFVQAGQRIGDRPRSARPARSAAAPAGATTSSSPSSPSASTTGARSSSSVEQRHQPGGDAGVAEAAPAPGSPETPERNRAARRSRVSASAASTAWSRPSASMA